MQPGEHVLSLFDMAGASIDAQNLGRKAPLPDKAQPTPSLVNR